MAVSPIIRLARSGTGTKLKKKPRGFPKPATDNRSQSARLGPRIDDRLARVVSGRDVEVDTDPTAFAPERVLVFEVLGNFGDFAKAARRIGLEWLAERIVTLIDPEIQYADRESSSEYDEDIADDVAFIMEEEEQTTTEESGRLYFGMPTIDSFRKLKSLWDGFKRDGTLPEGHSDWRELFLRLHDVRVWGPQDRIPPQTRVLLGLQVEEAPNSRLNVEIDLWYRSEPALRSAALRELRSYLPELGGEVLDSAEIAEIHYQAALISLPPSAVADLLQLQGPLVASSAIMSVRPQSMFRHSPEEASRTDTVTARSLQQRDPRPSLAALIDGYPVENHVLLRNRLDVVEIGVVKSAAPSPRRSHATAMASLILHGDLQEDGVPMDRVLKVIPILRPTDHGTEEPPADKLAIKMVWEAVEDLKIGRGGEDPSGPDVILVNHSICDEASPFAGTMSHWARALDHLAYTYGILFVTSAGNIRDGFALPAYATAMDLHRADPAVRRSEILLAVNAAKAERSMFSPAEAVNALTVGAAHADGSINPIPANVVDPYGDLRMSNIGSGLGMGFGRSVKPDFLMPGGRQAAQGASSPLSVRSHAAASCFGQLVAAPDVHGGSSSKIVRTSGTSNAAALATRAALIAADALDETFEGSATPWHSWREAACMLKALVAHSAGWGSAGDELDSLLPPTERGRHAPRRSNISRYLGYGLGDIRKVVDPTQHRVTLLAADLIEKNKRHEYRIPLPTELSSRTDLRRITVTLAWLTPPAQHRASYRTVALEVVATDGSSHLWEGVKRVPLQPPLGSSTKGTLFHTVYEGKNAVPYGPDGEFILNVQASSQLTGPTSRMVVPYALAVTLEVAQSVEADIFASVAHRMRSRIGARP